MEETITINKEQFTKLLNAAHCAHKDAHMALRGDWDKSDEGFEEQIYLLESALGPFEDMLDAPLESL